MDNELLTTQARELLSGENFDAFESGYSRLLLFNRNPNIGYVLGSDRSVFYLQVLYRMLLFRREHELEPLHEDLYRAVRPAQEAVTTGSYHLEQYLTDINQLVTWELITVRLEKERIRGYKDTRRTKYRYGLTKEAIGFLHWLEERLLDDIEDRISDARDLLEDAAGTLNELMRLLRPLAKREPDENEARRILFQLYKLQQTAQETGSTLAEFNARLHGFLVCEYNLDELRDLLLSLHQYVEKYLTRIGTIRQTMLGDLKRLCGRRTREKLQTTYNIMEAERRKTPRQLRSRSETLNPVEIPRLLRSFYQEQGALDKLCHRINDSALRVWRRMATHLKELERKSHRIEDLRERMREMATKPESFVPSSWLNGLLSWGAMCGDMHFWDDTTVSDPPRPRRVSWKQRRSPMVYLNTKQRSDGEIPQTMEQHRLNMLKSWIESHDFGNGKKISEGSFEEFTDFSRIIELARCGVLGNGKKLRSVGYELKIRNEFVELAPPEKVLVLNTTYDTTSDNTVSKSDGGTNDESVDNRREFDAVDENVSNDEQNTVDIEMKDSENEPHISHSMRLSCKDMDIKRLGEQSGDNK